MPTHNDAGHGTLAGQAFSHFAAMPLNQIRRHSMYVHDFVLSLGFKLVGNKVPFTFSEYDRKTGNDSWLDYGLKKSGVVYNPTDEMTREEQDELHRKYWKLMEKTIKDWRCGIQIGWDEMFVEVIVLDDRTSLYY
jgi:hypothetical protein